MSGAQIHDLGYRPYEGERAGVFWAMQSLTIHAAQRVLGIKRAARHKVLPVIAILIAFVPAIVFVGMAALLPDSLEDDFLPSYGEYYGFVLMAIFLLAAFAAPEAICTDRRTGMLALYMASPLNRTTYVVSKLASVVAILLTVTLFPLLFLLLAYTLEGSGPDGVADFVELFIRLFAAGMLTALYFACFTSAVCSFTPRRGVASAVIVLGLLIPTVLSEVLVNETDAADEVALIDLPGLPFRVAQYLLGEPGELEVGLEQLPGALVLSVMAGLTVAFAGITWWRYQNVAIDR